MQLAFLAILQFGLCIGIAVPPLTQIHLDHSHIAIEWHKGYAILAIRKLPEPSSTENYDLEKWRAYMCDIPGLVSSAYMMAGAGYAGMMMLECVVDKLPQDVRQVIMNDIELELG